MKEIRTLRADEIDVRVQSVKSNGAVFLLYKDARCDMRILDEVYGINGWQRSHDLINGNLFCTVEIWDEEKKMWIRKQDVGTESNTEKEKGQASDSFKRACFNIGIGRELYTSPFVWITPLAGEDLKYAKLSVKSIGYNENKEITELTIIDNKGNVRFQFVDGKQKRIDTPDKKAVLTPPSSTTPIESPSDIVFEVISKAKDLNEINEVWSTYPQYQRNQKFKNACTARKNEIKAQLQPAS